MVFTLKARYSLFSKRSYDIELLYELSFVLYNTQFYVNILFILKRYLKIVVFKYE